MTNFVEFKHPLRVRIEMVYGLLVVAGSDTSSARLTFAPRRDSILRDKTTCASLMDLSGPRFSAPPIMLKSPDKKTSSRNYTR